MPAENLKSRVDGNELDLSLSSLSVVPVKELAALPKATVLDLSCNLLTYLPSDFCTLIHLVKLDLSKNQLTELPENFGFLVKLQHLDLYQNKLRALPISFCRLNALKWLDIKDNQLDDSGLVSAAGECLSDIQCRTCAKNVVIYMKKVQSDHERERQKRLKEEREQAATRKAEEERELQRKRAEKKAEKEQRRLCSGKRAKEDADEEVLNGDSNVEQFATETRPTTERKKKKVPTVSCLQMMLAILLLIIAVLCGLYIYCSSQLDVKWCSAGMQHLSHSIEVISKHYSDFREKLLSDKIKH